MQKSCTTSVYATEYKPPTRVYEIATHALMMTAVVLSTSIMTESVEPAS